MTGGRRRSYCSCCSPWREARIGRRLVSHTVYSICTALAEPRERERAPPQVSPARACSAARLRQPRERIDRLPVLANLELDGADAAAVYTDFADGLPLRDRIAFLHEQRAVLPIRGDQRVVMLDDDERAIRLDARTRVDHAAAGGRLDRIAGASADHDAVRLARRKRL